MATFTVFTEDYRSRNKFLSLFLLLWGVICFAVSVRNAKDNTQVELMAASSFFIMLGSFMSLILLSMDHHDKLARAVTIFILVIGSFLLIATGGYITDKSGDGSTQFGCLIFSQIILIPSLITLIVAGDLWNQFCDDRRIRIISYTLVLLIVGILACVAYFKADQDNLSDEEKCTEAGYLLITAGAGLLFLVLGIAQKTDIAMFNAFIAFIMFLGNFLLLVNPNVEYSLVVVELVLLFCLIFLVTADAQAGGTIRVRRADN